MNFSQTVWNFNWLMARLTSGILNFHMRGIRLTNIPSTAGFEATDDWSRRTAS